MPCHRHEPRICAPRKLLTAVQQIRVEDRVRRTRKTLKLFLMSHLRSFSAAIESLTLTSGSVEDMLLAGQGRLGLECSDVDVVEDHTGTQPATLPPSAVCQENCAEEDDRL